MGLLLDNSSFPHRPFAVLGFNLIAKRIQHSFSLAKDEAGVFDLSSVADWTSNLPDRDDGNN